jgi:hypothetical protein
MKFVKTENGRKIGMINNLLWFLGGVLSGVIILATVICHWIKKGDAEDE